MIAAVAKDRARVPGWLEVGAGLFVMAGVAFGIGSQLRHLDLDRVNFGLLLTGWSGVAAIAGFGAAWAVRRPALATFGLRRTSARWLLLGAAAGVVAILIKGAFILALTALVEHVTNPQDVYATAGGGGTGSLIMATLLLGVFTPLGEEMLFRGVVTSALLRRGAAVGVIGSALVFAIMHGFSMAFPAALVEGIVAGEIFRRCGSLWPAVLVHVVYNVPTVPVMLLTGS